MAGASAGGPPSARTCPVYCRLAGYGARPADRGTPERVTRPKLQQMQAFNYHGVDRLSGSSETRHAQTQELLVSQTPSPPSRTYGPKSFLIMAAVCVAFGCAFYVLARQVLKQSKVTDTVRSETREVRTELEGYRKDTAPLPLAQEELKKRIVQIEEAHRAMTSNCACFV